MPNTFTLSGSHGELTACAISGHILQADACACSDCVKYGDYRSIALVDIAGTDPLTVQSGAGDILGAALIWRDGVRDIGAQWVPDGDGGGCYEFPHGLLPRPAERQVCLNGWARDEYGNENYADYYGQEHCDGFSVYLRIETPTDPIQPFDIPDECERDLSTYEAALAYADKLAAAHTCEVMEF